MTNEIIKETNYDKFRFTSKNRPVDSKKVQRFAKESSERPHLMESCPILVNSNMEIIDGQHRFLACKLNASPVYYIQDERVSYEDMVILNKDQKNWSIDDFINFHCQSGNKNFLSLREFMKKSGLTVSLSFVFLGFNRKSLVTAVKEGTLLFPSLEREERALRKSILCREFQKKVFSTSPSSELRMVFSYTFLEAVATLPEETDLDRFFQVLWENYTMITPSRGYSAYHYQFKALGAL